MRMRIRTLQWMNTIALMVMVIVNILANIIPIGIGDTGMISQKYSNLFTPAAFTFSIWAVIYVLMLAFVIYQWGIIDDRSKRVLVAIGPWFIVSCILNVAWLFAWHFDVIWLSVLIMIGLLVVLANIRSILDQTRKVGEFRTVIDIGFDVYLGWITAATIANISVFLVSINWKGFGISSEIWTCIVLIVGATIGFLFTLLDGKIFSTLAIMWAYVGILQRHVSSYGLNGEYQAVIICGVVAEILMLAVVVYALALKSSPQGDCDKCAYNKNNLARNTNSRTSLAEDTVCGIVDVEYE